MDPSLSLARLLKQSHKIGRKCLFDANPNKSAAVRGHSLRCLRVLTQTCLMCWSADIYSAAASCIYIKREKEGQHTADCSWNTLCAGGERPQYVSIRMRIWSGWWEGLSTVVSNILRIRFFTFSQFRLRDQTHLQGGKSKYQKNNCESSVFLSSSRAYWSICDAQIFWLVWRQNKINQTSSELSRVYILSWSDLNVLGAWWRKTAAQIL